MDALPTKQSFSCKLNWKVVYSNNNNNNNNNKLENLTWTIRIYSRNIGMEFGIEKCAMPRMKKGKRETTEGIELSNHESTKTRTEKENYKYLET